MNTNPTSPDQHYSIGMLLLPGFNSLAANAIVDPFRAANYLHGTPLYRWDWLAPTSSNVVASNGLSIENSSIYSDHPDKYDYVVVNASWTPEQYKIPLLLDWLINQSRRGSNLIGVDTGAFLFGYAGLLDGYRVTVHYEHMAAFSELFPKVELSEALYTFDRDRLSCCGGHAATDLALEVIRLNHSLDLANASARYIFHDRLRSPGENQLSGNMEPVGHAAPAHVREAILLMERNLEEPLDQPEIAQAIGISQRQLERVFKHHTGITPVKYYADVRLDRARGLLTQTEMSIVEIAAACGYRSAENFSRTYRKRFNLSPTQDRSEGRVPFHFRSFPSHAGLHEPDTR